MEKSKDQTILWDNLPFELLVRCLTKKPKCDNLSMESKIQKMDFIEEEK